MVDTREQTKAKAAKAAAKELLEEKKESASDPSKD